MVIIQYKKQERFIKAEPRLPDKKGSVCIYVFSLTTKAVSMLTSHRHLVDESETLPRQCANVFKHFFVLQGVKFTAVKEQFLLVYDVFFSAQTGRYVTSLNQSPLRIIVGFI